MKQIVIDPVAFLAGILFGYYSIDLESAIYLEVPIAIVWIALILVVLGIFRNFGILKKIQVRVPVEFLIGVNIGIRWRAQAAPA